MVHAGSDNCQRLEENRVSSQHDEQRGEPRTSLFAHGVAVQERQRRQEKCHQGEEQDSQRLGDVLERLEHEKKIPLRLDADRGGLQRIGLDPDFRGQEHRQSADRAGQQQPDAPVDQGEFAEEGAMILDLSWLYTQRKTHALKLNQGQVHAQDNCKSQGHDHHVGGVKSGNRLAGDLLAAAEEMHEEITYPGHRARYLRTHQRGVVRELVPRQQVSGETGGQRERQQDDAGDPGQLPRLSIRPSDKHREKVQAHYRDEEVCAPNVHTAHQPPKGHLGHDPAHALMGRGFGRLIIEHQQTAAGDLQSEQEQGRTAQRVNPAMPVHGHRLFGRDGQHPR